MNEPRLQIEMTRPWLFDYLALFAGVGLSVYLMRLAPLSATASHPLDPRVATVFEFLPVLMRLTEGIVLLWPIFFLAQWLTRTDGLTSGEWLWLLGWVGVALLTALTAWDHLLGLPESFRPHAAKPRILWYMVLTPALAALAVVVQVIDLFRSPVPAWTHGLGVALMIWPAPPALIVLAGGEFVAR